MSHKVSVTGAQESVSQVRSAARPSPSSSRIAAKSASLHVTQSRPWENESPQMNAAIPERRPATEEISGLIERVTFHNDENGFCVLRVRVRGHRDEVFDLAA